MVKIADALRSVSILAVDTPPYIYVVEKHPVYLAIATAVFRWAEKLDAFVYSSIICITEIMVKPIRMNDYAVIQAYNAMFMTTSNLSLIPVSSAIALRAAELRAQYQLKTPDAIHLATALHAGAQAFLTNDVQLKRVKELSVLVLDELEEG